MNGRIYDPLLGRFLSADVVVQAPRNLQSYNRYSYVMNNPLTLTDPTGFNWWDDVKDWFKKKRGNEERVENEKPIVLEKYTVTATRDKQGERNNRSQDTYITYSLFLGRNGVPSADEAIWYDAEAAGNMANREAVRVMGDTIKEGARYLPTNVPVEMVEVATGIDIYDSTVSGEEVEVSRADKLVELGEQVAVAKAASIIGTVIKPARIMPGPIFKTSKEAAKAAEARGWKLVPGLKSGREAVYTDGKRFFSRDNTGHIGGAWKELDRRAKRLATLDVNLNPIGK